MLPLTVIVPTKNEEAAIASCLSRLIGYFDQVLVVDSNSSDSTVRISEECGATVLTFEWDGKYPKKKEWCLRRPEVRHDWVLFVDADELVTKELRDELGDLAHNNYASKAAFDVEFDYWWNGTRLRHGQTVVKRILLNKSMCHFPSISDLDAPGMGEQEGHYQPVTSGPTGRLRSRMKHDDPGPVFEWIARHNRYSDWEAYLRANPQARQEVATLRSSQGQIFEMLPFKPVAIFVYNYIYRRGFLDGRAGFHYALALSLYQVMILLKEDACH